MKKPLVVFDLETTGVKVAIDRIIEFGYVKIYPNGDREEKVRKINPGMLIPKEATDVHGISNEDVANEPYFHQIAKGLHDILDGCDLAGFNLKRFDIPMLIEEFLRCNIEWSLDGIDIWDSYEVEAELMPRTLSGTYKRYMGKDFDDAHTALADSQATLEIMEKQKLRMEEIGPNLDSMELVSKYFMAKKKPYKFCFEFYEDAEGIIRFNIGKHKDKCVHDEPGYMRWMLGQEFSNHTKNIINQLISK